MFEATLDTNQDIRCGRPHCRGVLARAVALEMFAASRVSVGWKANIEIQTSFVRRQEGDITLYEEPPARTRARKRGSSAVHHATRLSKATRGGSVEDLPAALIDFADLPVLVRCARCREVSQVTARELLIPLPPSQ